MGSVSFSCVSDTSDAAGFDTSVCKCVFLCLNLKFATFVYNIMYIMLKFMSSLKMSKFAKLVYHYTQNAPCSASGDTV